MAQDVHLKQLEAKSFMGIDSSSPIIIDFSKAKKNQNVVKLTGDQGTRKTSTITALMYLLGAAFNIDQKNFKNLNDDTIDLSLDFEHNGEKYKAEVKGTRFSLKSFVKEKWIPESQPKELIRKMVGPLGVSPMFLKEMAGKKQIQWFKDMFGTDENSSKKEVKLVSDINELFENRREANRTIKNLRGSLTENPLYADYEGNMKKFKTTVSAEKEKAAYEAITKRNRDYEKGKELLVDLGEELSDTQIEIGRLKVQLQEAEKSEKDIQARLEKGRKYVDDNKDVPKEYKKAEQDWMNLSKTISDQNAWKDVVKKQKELDEFETASLLADGALDDLRKSLLALTKTYLPDIEGLEMKIRTGLDEEEEGLYYNGKTLAMLSESELWALFTQIWELKGVRFVFCENANSLGSDAIAILNKLAKEGALIIASEMVRKQDEIEFSIQTKID